MRTALGVAIGGGLGFCLGYLGRCSAGTCPLTGNPYVSTIIGAAIGALVARGF